MPISLICDLPHENLACSIGMFQWNLHISMPCWRHFHSGFASWQHIHSKLKGSRLLDTSQWPLDFFYKLDSIRTTRNPVSCTQIYFHEKLWSEFNLMFRVSYEYNWVYSVHIRMIRVGMSCETPYTAGVPSGSHTTGMAGIADVCGSLSRKTNMPASAAR